MYLQVIDNKGSSTWEKILYIFYFVIYTIVWLWDYIQRKWDTICKIIVQVPYFFLSDHPKTISFPNHIALSGALANFPDGVAKYLLFCVRKGASDLTIYDPHEKIDWSKLLQQLLEGEANGFWSIKEISKNGSVTTGIKFSDLRQAPSATEKSEHNIIHNTEHSNVEIRLTVVREGMGRESLMLAARHIADNCNPDAEPITAEEVAKYLDEDKVDMMLPSEPDVVVVFPDKETPYATLDEFPVWQLRLTQIRFAEQPICHTTERGFLAMVESAANAEKRFGR